MQNEEGLVARIVWGSSAPKAIARVRSNTKSAGIVVSAESVASVEMPDELNDASAASALQPSLADAHARASAAVAQQVAFWEQGQMQLSIDRFQLFGVPMQMVHRGSASTSVVDIKSYQKRSLAGTISTAREPMLEGVNELIFFLEPQLQVAQATSAGQCRLNNPILCRSQAAGRMAPAVWAFNVPDSCGTASSCEFSVLNWVNDHIAIHTHLRAIGSTKKQIAAFAQRLMTMPTKGKLAAFEIDPSFDQATECRR